MSRIVNDLRRLDQILGTQTTAVDACAAGHGFLGHNRGLVPVVKTLIWWRRPSSASSRVKSPSASSATALGRIRLLCPPAEIAREIASNDSRSVMDEVAAALRSRQVGNSENAERLELPDPGGNFRWEK